MLENNAHYQDHGFQNQVSLYQQLTAEVIKGSNYQVEIYKKKYKEIEVHCQELEKKVEFIFLNQTYYEEIVEDFVQYKKISDICMERGGYLNPSKKFLIIRYTKWEI